MLLIFNYITTRKVKVKTMENTQHTSYLNLDKVKGIIFILLKEIRKPRKVEGGSTILY